MNGVNSVHIDYMASFRDAAELLGLSSAELGRIFDRPTQSMKQMRLDPRHPNHRPPPDGWEEILRPLVEERIRDLERLRSELGGKAA